MKRLSTSTKASKEVLILRGYDMGRKSFVNFSIFKKLSSLSVIDTYICGEKEEEYEEVEVGGYLLALLQGAIYQKDLDIEISNLSTVIPSLRDPDKEQKITRCLKKLKSRCCFLLKKKGSMLSPSYTASEGLSPGDVNGFATGWTKRSF